MKKLRPMWTACVAAALCLAAMSHAADELPSPRPQWLLDHMEFMTEGSGVWVADNAGFISEQETAEAYATEWEWEMGRTSIRGRLFGIENGVEAGTFWTYVVFWDPGASVARMVQFGRGGVLGEGPMWLEEDGTLRSEMTFLYPGRGTERVAHDLVERPGEHVTRSYGWSNGEWLPRREYVWERRAEPVEEEAFAPSTSHHFDPVGSFAGSCWKGVYPNGATDVHCYEWVAQGAFLEDTHQVMGESGLYEGTTFYGWNPSEARLEFWYFNSLGGVSTGFARETEDGWVFEEAYEDQTRQLTMRTIMTRPDAASYAVRVETLRDGRWVAQEPTRFERLDEPHRFAKRWFPGDADFLYTAKRDGNSDLYVRSPEGLIRRLTSHPSADNGGRWSPDGSRIAFQSQRDGNYEIYVMNSDGTGKRNLTHDPGFDGLPVWSPDGSTLAFFSNREVDESLTGQFPGHIYLVPVKGGTPVRLTRKALDTTYGASDWSADGESLLLSRIDNLDADVVRLDIETGSETRLTRGEGHKASAAFSPDGSRIAYYRTTEEGSEIVVMNRDGAEPEVITSGERKFYYPRWSPDGRWITVTTVDPEGEVDVGVVPAISGPYSGLIQTAEDERESSWRPSGSQVTP